MTSRRLRDNDFRGSQSGLWVRFPTTLSDSAPRQWPSRLVDLGGPALFFAKAQGCASMVGTRFSGPLRATPKISAGDVMIIEGAGPSPAKHSFDAVAGSTSRRRFESHGWPLKRGDAYRGTDQPGRAQNGNCGCGDLGEVTSGG